MDGRPPEGEPRGLQRAAVDAREDLADGKADAPHAAADRARVGPSLGGEVPLRRAVGDDDGILVGLREVGRRMPEDEDEAPGAKLAREVLVGRGGGARGERHGQRGDGDPDE